MTEPTNSDRASWADKAIRAFMAETGTDYEDSLGDLLCDLMHWAESAQFDFAAALACAEQNYSDEIKLGMTCSRPKRPAC